MLDVIVNVCSGTSSVLFIVVVAAQGKMYGWRTWVEYGLGVGKPVHNHPPEPMCIECPMRGEDCRRE